MSLSGNGCLWATVRFLFFFPLFSQKFLIVFWQLFSSIIITRWLFANNSLCHPIWQTATTQQTARVNVLYSTMKKNKCYINIIHELFLMDGISRIIMSSLWPTSIAHLHYRECMREKLVNWTDSRENAAIESKCFNVFLSLRIKKKCSESEIYSNLLFLFSQKASVFYVIWSGPLCCQLSSSHLWLRDDQCRNMLPIHLS